MANLLIERVRAPERGLDYDSTPEAIGTSNALELENFLPFQFAGRAGLRGPISRWGTRDESALKVPVGCMVHDDGFCLSFITSAGAFDTAGNYFGTDPITYSAADRTPSYRSAQLADTTYGFASGVGATTRRLMSWDGTTTAPAAINTANLTNTPYDGVDVCVHLNRLFVLGAKMDAYTAQDSLMWSDAKSGTSTISSAVTEWQDDVSGLTNRVVIDLGPDEDLVGMSKVGGHLAIFASRSVWLLTGRTPATFNLRKVANTIGCLTVESLVEVDDSVVFLSGEGLMRFDGASFTRIDEGIHTPLMDAAAETQLMDVYDPASTVSVALQGHCRILVMPGGYLLVMVFSLPYSTGVLDLHLCALGHVSGGPWSTFKAPVMENDYPIMPIHYSAPIAFDGISAWTLAQVLHPKRTNTYPVGFDINDAPDPHVYTDYVPRWTSKTVQLSSPARNAQITRVYVDYLFNDSEATDGDADRDAWTLELVGPDGTTIHTKTLPVQADVGTSSYTYRRRYAYEVMEEASEVYVVLTWDPGASTQRPTRAEIHDVWIEYSTSHTVAPS